MKDPEITKREENQTEVEILNIHYSSSFENVEQARETFVADVKKIKENRLGVLLGDFNISLVQQDAEGKLDVTEAAKMLVLMKYTLEGKEANKKIENSDIELAKAAILKGSEFKIRGYKVGFTLPGVVEKERVKTLANEQINKGGEKKIQDSMGIITIEQVDGVSESEENDFQVDIDNSNIKKKLVFGKNISHTDHWVLGRMFRGTLYVALNAFDPKYKTSNLTEEGHKLYSSYTLKQKKAQIDYLKAILEKKDGAYNHGGLADIKVPSGVTVVTGGNGKESLEWQAGQKDQVVNSIRKQAFQIADFIEKQASKSEAAHQILQLCGHLKDNEHRLQGDNREWNNLKPKDKLSCYIDKRVEDGKLDDLIERRFTASKPRPITVDDIINNLIVPVFGLQQLGGFELNSNVESAIKNIAERRGYALPLSEKHFEMCLAEHQSNCFAPQIADLVDKYGYKEDIVIAACEVSEYKDQAFDLNYSNASHEKEQILYFTDVKDSEKGFPLTFLGETFMKTDLELEYRQLSWYKKASRNLKGKLPSIRLPRVLEFSLGVGALVFVSSPIIPGAFMGTGLGLSEAIGLFLLLAAFAVYFIDAHIQSRNYTSSKAGGEYNQISNNEKGLESSSFNHVNSAQKKKVGLVGTGAASDGKPETKVSNIPGQDREKRSQMPQSKTAKIKQSLPFPAEHGSKEHEVSDAFDSTLAAGNGTEDSYAPSTEGVNL